MLKLISTCFVVLALSACGGGGGSLSSVPVGLQSAPNGLTNGRTSSADGRIGAAYIECDTLLHIAAGPNCGNNANFDPATATFTFTAIAATSFGTPIYQQLASGVPLEFQNGSYRVIEAANDNPQIVRISGGPWSAPGATLSDAVGSYGDRFYVQCTHTGTATLQVQLVAGSSAQTLPFATTSYASNEVSVNCTASSSVTIN